MTVDGQVFGLAQKSSGQDTATICYAIDANFAMSQNISALSYGDMSLKFAYIYILSYIIPIIVSGFITYVQYINAVVKPIKGGK